MRQDRYTPAGRRSRACVKQRQQQQLSSGVGNVISNVLKKRNGISRSAPRLLCTLEPGVDTRLKFTIEPSLGKNGFQQWYDALKAVARLPTGIPKEWRKRVWLTLADQYLHSISIDWEKTLRFAFNERSNPDDDSLGIQIVKDLHRTGCSSYCGQEGEQDRVVLKRVLLAFARWNKAVGYCQGFNVLAALILEVTEGNESDALKVMIYLIDKVLPESYFANNLQALSVDMAVFRDLLRLKLSRLSQHLHHLQKMANREAGGSYEPPLTNVFTMQWFLTMFATCLPPHTVLKIWDSVFFEGSEVLLRVGLAIWERLGERIEYCQTADEFYSTMGCLTQEMLEHGLIDPVDLMQEVYSMAVFPFPQLAELREKYTYNITPFPTSVKPSGSGNLGGWESDDDAEMDDEDSVVTALGCLGPLGGLLAPELQRYQNNLRADQRREQGSIAELSPGAVGAGGPAGAGRLEPQAAVNSMMMERMSTDIGALKQQYVRIKRRQQQQAMQLYIRTGPEYPVSTNLGVPSNPADHHINDKCPATSVLPSQLGPSSPVVNHLLLGKKPRGGSPCLRGSRAVGGGGSAQARTSSQRLPSSPGRGAAAGSPWRAHVRAHRRNLAHARAQLGFRETEEEEGEEEREEGEEEREEGEGDRGSRDAPVSPTPGGAVSDPGEEGAGAIEEGVASLDLEAEPPATVVPDDDNNNNNNPVSRAPSPSPALPDAPDPPQLPLPLLILPSTPPRGESDSSGSDSNASPASPPLPPPFSPSLSPPCSSTPSPTPNSSTLLPPPPPSPSVFSPFPSVKRPRRSPAARNLGLYGPTPRTPAVRFPQLSRGLGQSIGAAAATRRQ